MSTTASTSTKTCSSCAHWKAEENNNGECRRHAPQVVSFEIDSSLSIESKFPTTSASDWCGDYEEK